MFFFFTFLFVAFYDLNFLKGKRQNAVKVLNFKEYVFFFFFFNICIADYAYKLRGVRVSWSASVLKVNK